jgi:spore coat protein U-like protein
MFNFFKFQRLGQWWPLMGLCCAVSGHAATSTGDMTVSANVEASCTVSVSPMDFGTVLPGVTKDTDAVVSVVCTSGTTYTLDLGDGLNHTIAGGTGTQYRRQMAAAANRLPYAVYQEPERATEIAATSSLAANNNMLTSTVGNGLAQEKIIYGRVIGAETVTQAAGVYTDTVIVTVAF